ncbi:MAG: 5'/3'-nucleotidase SurE [Nocardioides sp.]
MPRQSRLIAVALAAVAALVVGLLTGQAGASAPKPPANVKGLKIMLTNDDSVQGTRADGSDGKGLYELRKALCAAGADVVVVGPWGQQSGQSGRITTDRGTGLTVTPVTPPAAYADDCADASAGGHVYGVCHSNTACEAGSPSASPADTVKVGVENFLPATFWAKGPDLVLSGINWGQNAGTGVVHSGTTSAAVTAHELGVPALALSEEFDLLPCATQGLNCPAYAPGAKFTVKLIRKLRANRQLKPSLLLNVNFPFVGEGEKARKPAINVLGNGDMIAIAWAGAATEAGGTYQLGYPSDRKSTNKRADTEALRANRISIVPMDGDWTATPSKNLNRVLKTLK